MLPRNTDEFIEQFPVGSELWMVIIKEREEPGQLGPVFVRRYSDDFSHVVLVDEEGTEESFHVDELLDNCHATFSSRMESADYLLFLVDLYINSTKFFISLHSFIKEQDSAGLKELEYPFLVDDDVDYEEEDANFDGDDDFGVDLEDDSGCDLQ